MISHIDVLNNMPSVRATLISRYKWFIHTTPDCYIDRIREAGLNPHQDAPPPEQVKAWLESATCPILTLHPLGAKRCPRPAASTLTLPAGGGDDTNFVSLAIDASDLPARLGLDWSYDWPRVESRLTANVDNMKLEELVVHLIDQVGSVASYDKIDNNKLRVFCFGNTPANPLTWQMLNRTNNSDILRHDP